MKQTFTIFRTERTQKRLDDGTRVPGTTVSRYPGFGSCPRRALDMIMQEVAGDESDILAEMPADDPDFDHELMSAVENLQGSWDVYPGVLQEAPMNTVPAYHDRGYNGL